MEWCQCYWLKGVRVNDIQGMTERETEDSEERWCSIALLSSALPYLPPYLALWHCQILLRFWAHIHEMLNQVICNLNRFLQTMLISPSLSTTASIPSSSCGTLSGVRFFSINSTTFGSLLLQYMKNLSHGTLWHKYVLFSVTHNTLLYNCFVVSD